ncbi:hypothetical protein P8452_61592 [Trifolium repens]|nr:hypothetical protein P8452_61592 [Trifolium repens]
MSSLSCAVNDCDLTDIPINGYPFTWFKSSGTERMIEERLDRALASSDWLEKFPNATLRNILSSHSNHSPILLHCSPVVKHSYKHDFKFENSWLLEEDVGEVVQEGWNDGNGLELTHRLTHCADKLQRWGRRKKGRFKEAIQEHEAEMERLRNKHDSASVARFQEANHQHAKILIQEEAFWKQRAKMHWLKEGDLNTKFFHMSATARSKFKKIGKLTNDEDEIITGQQNLCGVAQKYFHELFTPKGGVLDPVLSLISPRVSDDDNVNLEAPITKEEVRVALFQMHPDKSPGPDGFNLAFYQNFWELCGDEVFTAVKEWLGRGYFPSTLNETNICLIPKCDNPSSMRDFRLISLCNVLYKVVSKLLANRLKVVLGKYISEEQSTFVEGRSIIDNALIATEIIHCLKRCTRGAKGELALKIDFSKAYDKVEWSYLKGVLGRMGFSDTWIKWMMLCVSSVNYSALVNFEKVGPIHPGRGLRQGDPLSPYLFILITEGLTSLIHKAVACGDLHGVKICRGAPVVSHLLFADDCFLFCRSNISETTKLMEILKTYEMASGQEINLSKSEVFFSRNISRAGQEDLSNIMGVKHVLGTGPYLGLPSMVGRSKKGTFAYINDRIWKRINGWRSRPLSRAGKEVMIKSVLQAIPAYIMNIYLLPDTLINDIERMINAFWWGGGSDNRGIRIYKARWQIGDGSKIRVMNEPWLRSSQGRCLNAPQTQNVYNLKVQHLLLPNVKRWDENKLRSLFSLEVVNEILALLVLDLVREDKLIWCEENDGVYSVRTGYRILMKENNKGYGLRQIEGWSSAVLILSKAAVLMWFIWQNRNNKVWNDSNLSAQQVGVQALTYWHQWATINGLLQEHQQPAPHTTAVNNFVQWNPPPFGFLKCNVDASFFNTVGATGCGWILRDYRGQFQLAGSNIMHASLSVLEGEAMALIEAMEEVLHMGLSFVIFESDSKLVVDAISSRQAGVSDFSILISHIQSLISNNNYFEVKYVKRQANRVAHSLARAALSMSSRRVFDSVPPCIDSILINEVC